MAKSVSLRIQILHALLCMDASEITYVYAKFLWNNIRTVERDLNTSNINGRILLLTLLGRKRDLSFYYNNSRKTTVSYAHRKNLGGV